MRDATRLHWRREREGHSRVAGHGAVVRRAAEILLPRFVGAEAVVAVWQNQARGAGDVRRRGIARVRRAVERIDRQVWLRDPLRVLHRHGHRRCGNRDSRAGAARRGAVVLGVAEELSAVLVGAETIR